MGTYHNSKAGHGLVNLIIGASLLVFVLVLAVFILKIIVGLAPLLGLLIMIAGGIWYFQADNEAAKLRALQTAFAGLAIMVIFGMIF
jgi:hypothetical protein